MQFEIIFCADGILRARWGEKKKLLPLEFIYNQTKKERTVSDLGFWSNWWGYEVHFEKGLTVAMFLQALEPWQNFFEEWLGIAVSAYIKESRKLTLAEKTQESYLALFIQNQFMEDIAYEDKPEDISFVDFIKSERKRKLTGEWKLERNYMLSKFVLGEVEHYSVHDSPFNEFANLPLVLDNKQYFCAFDYRIRERLGENKTIFNQNAHGMQKAVDKNGDHPVQFLMGECTHTFESVMKGFFNGFPANPFIRDQNVKKIKEALAGTNIEDMSKEEKPETTAIKVSFNPHAFDDLFEYWAQEESYWDSMTESAAQQHEVLRIGQIKYAQRPDMRIFGYIVDYNNQETDYK